MIGSILRRIGAVMAGLAAAMFFIVATEAVWAVVYPFPPGVDQHDLNVCKAHILTLPADAYVIASLGWGLSMLSGVWVATRLGPGRHATQGRVVGSILLFAAVANMLMLPYPIWFWVLNLLTFTAAEMLGTKWGRGRFADQQTVAKEALRGRS